MRAPFQYPNYERENSENITIFPRCIAKNISILSCISIRQQTKNFHDDASRFSQLCRSVDLAEFNAQSIILASIRRTLFLKFWNLRRKRKRLLDGSLLSCREVFQDIIRGESPKLTRENIDSVRVITTIRTRHSRLIRFEDTLARRSGFGLVSGEEKHPNSPTVSPEGLISGL
jgi:hypothetical protein